MNLIMMPRITEKKMQTSRAFSALVPAATARSVRRHRWAGIGIALLFAVALPGCERGETPADARVAAPQSATETVRSAQAPAHRDLAVDEALGGHTLARHVGKTDDELRARLRRERDISSASTYTDRATAEAVVGGALSSGGRSFDAWHHRSGRRPNFVLHVSAGRIIGRSIARGRFEPASCSDALVVLRWDDRRQQFYVLTSYPEEQR